MAATIIDVAKACGYSKATVARAFSAPETVSMKAREQIYAAAKQLNYAPNVIARAMARQRTENITFIINERQSPAVLNPFYSGVLEAVMQETARRNYSIFVTEAREMRLPGGESFIRRHMDGVIYAGEPDVGLLTDLLAKEIPTVLVNNTADLPGLVSVTADHLQGARAAAGHLYERGHRRIGLLAGRFSKQVTEARLQGYAEALFAHGLQPDPEIMANVEPTAEEAERAALGLLERPDRPTALFCTNDLIAVGAMKAAARLGLQVPEDLALVGYDDSMISRLTIPPLTTVRIDTAALGRTAAEILFRMINGEAPEAQSLCLPVELILRETT